MPHRSAISTEPRVLARGLAVRYPRHEAQALEGADLTLRRGEVAWILGPNGSGKSTLGLCVAGMLPGVVPGRRSGQIEVLGADPSGLPPRQRVEATGIIHQDPSTQLCTLTVESEIALLLENKNTPAPSIPGRVSAVLEELGISHLAGRDVLSLSGGEKQLVAVASLAVDPPRVIVLDEPCAYLDDDNRTRVLEAIKGMRERIPEVNLVFIEHRTDGLPAPDRIFRVKEARLSEEAEATGLPVWGADFSRLPSLPGARDGSLAGARDGEPLLKVRGLSFGYPKSATIISDLNLDVRPGEVVVVRGKNGSGKTTLLRLLAGDLTPSSGGIELPAPATDGTSALSLVPQNPEHLFVTNSVEEELGDTPEDMVRRFGLLSLGERNPYTLSTGQKRRLTLALAASHPGRLVLMDEPTFGLDADGVKELIALIGELRTAGKGLVVVTHDAAFGSAVADRELRLDIGQEAGSAESGADGDRAPAIPRNPERPRGLATLNPLARGLVALLFVVGASVIASRAVLGLWLALGVATLLLASTLGPFSLLRRMVPFLLIGAGFLWANLLFHKSGDLTQGLSNGLMLLLRAVVFGTFSLIFIQDLDPEGFAHALMRYLRAPPMLVYATLIAFRLGPELRIEKNAVDLALRLRGVARRLRRTKQVFFAVFVSAFRRAGRISIALEGRGLDIGPRSFATVPPFRKRDLAAILIGVVAFVAPLTTFAIGRWGGSYF